MKYHPRSSILRSAWIRFAGLTLIATAPACAETPASAQADATPPQEAYSTASPQDQALAALALDAAAVAAGRETYASFCLACHGPEGNTVDSPSNIFDKTWHHGSSPSAIDRSTREGIIEKGMPPWGQMLPQSDLQNVLAYLLSFQISNPE